MSEESGTKPTKLEKVAALKAKVHAATVRVLMARIAAATLYGMSADVEALQLCLEAIDK